MFSEPQPGVTRLVDLTALGWPPLEHTEAGLCVAATCTLAQLEAFDAPEGWIAAPVIGQCCRALLGSFKIRRVATVGGNLCLALPAAPMAALTVALHGTCSIWDEAGGAYELPAEALIAGAGRTILQPGQILRSVADRDTRGGPCRTDHHRGSRPPSAAACAGITSRRRAGGSDRRGSAGLVRRYPWQAGLAAADHWADGGRNPA